MFDAAGLGLFADAEPSGLRRTVLKWPPSAGAVNPIAGEIPIGFCNVFLMSQVTVGLVSLLYKNVFRRAPLEQPEAYPSLVSRLLTEVDSAATMG